MRELVGEREHLCRLRVGAVDEDERSHGINERETSELVRVELARVVAADDTADHHEDTCGVSLRDETPQRLNPRWTLPALLEIELQHLAHLIRNRGGSDIKAGGPHERKGPEPCRASESPVPLLSLLAELQGVEQVGAGTLPFDGRRSS